jgi:hypothetical protein
MLELVIAFVVGLACGRALDWYKNMEPGQETKVPGEPVEEEIPVTEEKSE